MFEKLTKNDIIYWFIMEHLKITHTINFELKIIRYVYYYL